MLLFLSLFLWAGYASAEMVILHVFVNEEDQGEKFFHMAEDGDVLMPPTMLEKMGLNHLPQGTRVTLEGEQYVSLSSLHAILNYRMDESDLSLHITAEAGLFDANTVDLSNQSRPDVTKSIETTAFFNYALNEARDHQFQSSSTALSLESGVSIKGVLGFSSFSYTHMPKSSSKFVRLLSNITWDDTDHLRQVVLGDFSANSGQLGGGGSFAGLSISRKLELDPYLVIFPGLNVTGVLKTPSDVDIYVNDRLVDSTHLAPGPFDLQNISANSGAGDVRLVIRDAYGRKTEITTPFYQVSNLLKQGLHDYSYNIGLKRRHMGVSNFSYAKPTLLVFHNYGVTTWLTLGMRGEADQRTVNAGPILSLALGGFGQVSATGAIGRRGNTQGVAGSLNYSFSGTPFTFGASLTSYSKDYVNISSPDQPLVSERLLASASLGVNFSSFGSVSGSAVYADAYNDRPSNRFSLSYSRPLFENISFQIRGSATKTDRWSKSFFIGANFSLGSANAGSIQHDWQDNQSRQSLDFSQNAPRGTGLGGRAHIERSRRQSGKTDYNGDMFAQYNGSYGIYTASARQIARKNSYDFGLAGGLAWIDHDIYFSRPINDAFALVKVKGMKNITVLNSNSKVGETDSSGKILIPDIISHYGNNISIDVKNIPINYEIDSESQKIAAPLRGGAVINFNVRKLQAFIGNFHYISDGKTDNAKYWGLELMMDGKPKQFILGDKGGFYLENIAAGAYKARIFDKHRTCSFVMVIPDSEEMMVDMGDLSCELHSGKNGDGGSRGLIDSGIHSNQPTHDTIAPVKKNKLKDDSLLNSNKGAGKPNSHGSMPVPDIISNNGNDISIDAPDIVVNYDIGSDSQKMGEL